MGLTEKAKELADTALLRAGEYSEKAAGRAAELSGVAREKAPGYLDRAADLTVRAVDAATSRVDRVTGGRFHDKLEGASAKVSDSLRDQPGTGPTVVDEQPPPSPQPHAAEQEGSPTTPAATTPEATGPDTPGPARP